MIGKHQGCDKNTLWFQQHMWRHLGKPILWRDKKNRLWLNTVHSYLVKPSLGRDKKNRLWLNAVHSHLGKPSLWNKKKNRLWSDAALSVQHLIREPGLFVTSMSICRKYFSRFLHNRKTNHVYKYMYMENADLGKHCLLLHKLGFFRWHHICTIMKYCSIQL